MSRVDSLEGTTVVSQEQAPVSQSILAELTVPNSCDAPNSNDCIDLSSSIDLLNERNESIVTLNNNAASTANSNIIIMKMKYIVMIVVEKMKIVKELCIAMIVVEITEIVKVLMLLYLIIMKWKYFITLVIVTLMVLMILKSTAMHPSLP